MTWVSQLTEGLANLNVKWVLLAIGIGVVVYTLFRALSRGRNSGTAWMAENVQVLLSVVVVVFLLIRPFLFQAFYIPSGSMEPTLMGPRDTPGSGVHETSGDRLLVNKLIYRLTNPSRFDIAVFKAPPQADSSEKEFIKRVIGLPGETVEVIPPRLLVDGRGALNLSVEGSGTGYAVGNPDEAAARIAGDRAELSNFGGALKVLAAPSPSIVFDRGRVEVNGKTELEDPNGSITETTGLSAWGGASEVAGKVYSINGEPRLLVVSGYQLAYDPGHVTINGRRIDEHYTKEAPRYAMAPVTLKSNEYFMMGDNRNNSNDSHHWGPLTRERVIGRAEVLFWPLNRFHIIQWWLLSLLLGLLVGYNAIQYYFAGVPRREHAANPSREDALDPTPQPVHV